MNKQIAFLGLGLMGGAMTANISRSGWQVKGWNRTANKPGIAVAINGGATVVNSIEEAVNSAEVIFSCVGDVADVEEVLLGHNGVINFAKPGALIVDMSTIGPQAARLISTALNQRNLRFLDAPVSGGDLGAKNGTLTIMVGGNSADFEECQPLLATMGKKITYCGNVGSGQAVKMCNQILCSLNLIGICEALTLAKEQSIDPNLIIEICSTGAAGSWALTNLGPKILASDLDPGFAIKHIIKDLRLVQESRGESEQKLPGLELADRLFKIVADLDNGMGKEQGTQAMIRAYFDQF
jgi:3-hydroxyisobutyrate dehydrogenase